MMSDFNAGMNIFFVTCLVIRLLADIFWARRSSRCEKTSAGKYLSLPDDKKWFYASYYNSIVYSTVLVVLVIKAALSCKPEHAWATALTDSYCRDNPTEQQIRLNAFMVGTLVADLLIQIFFVKDFRSPGALQNYLHHVLAIFGAVAGNSIGRFIGTLSNITLITEITTPFVSNRWILHFHNKVDSTAYFINGLCMTIGFGLFRIVFLSYIVIFLAPSAFKQNDFSKDP